MIIIEKQFKEDIELELQKLKNELIRLDLGDNPSRTQYQNNYDKTKAPAPTTMMRRTGLKWPEMLNYIGVTKAPLKAPHDWTKYTNIQLIDIVIKAMRKYSVSTSSGYSKKRREVSDDKMPDLKILAGRGIFWGDIIDRYNSKYPKSQLKTRKFLKTTADKAQALSDVIVYLKKNHINSWGQFMLAKDTGVPSMSSLRRYTGLKDAELTDYVRKHGIPHFSGKHSSKSKQDIFSDVISFIKENRINSWEIYDSKRTAIMPSHKQLIALAGSKSALNITIETLTGMKTV